MIFNVTHSAYFQLITQNLHYIYSKCATMAQNNENDNAFGNKLIFMDEMFKKLYL